MNTYAALIRGINVGGRNSLPMKELVALLAELGCEQINTYIQSGNAVFQSDLSTEELPEEIASAINSRRSFKPHVMVLSEQTFMQALASNPFPEGEADPKTLHLGFLDSVPTSPDLVRLKTLQAPGEQFKLTGQVFYLLAPNGIGRSKLAGGAEKSLGTAMTMRNWKTARKIGAMLESL